MDNTWGIRALTRTCYLISSPGKGFLVGADHGTPEFSCSAHTALQNGHAWLCQTVAVKKVQEVERIWRDVRFDLVCVTFVQEGGQWVPQSQQGVHPCAG